MHMMALSVVVTFLCVFELLGSAVLAQVPETSPPVGSIPYVGASVDCFATDRCDFFFLGSGPGAPLPTLDLGSGLGDYPIGPLVVSKQGQNVITINTNHGYQYTGSSPIPNDNQNQFYGNGAFLYARTFNQPRNLADYKGRCYLVPLSAVQLADGTNLLPDDNNGAYPEPKRCLVFRAGGDSPQTNNPAGGSCWSKEQFEIGWAAYEAASRAVIQAALEDDTRGNATSCTSGQTALESVLANEAARLSTVLEGCPGNVSSYVLQRTVLEAQSVEAKGLALVLSDDSNLPGRKLLRCYSVGCALRKAKNAAGHAVAATGRAAADAAVAVGNVAAETAIVVADMTVEVVQDVGDYVKRHNCEVSCGFITTLLAGGCTGLCAAQVYPACLKCAVGASVVAIKCQAGC